MSDDWRDFEPGRTGISVARLDDGQSVVCRIVGEPFRRETEESENALHVPVVFDMDSVPKAFFDMSGYEIQEGKEYNIINSSTAFFNALMQEFPDGNSLEGKTVEISAEQPKDAFSRTYEVTQV